MLFLLTTFKSTIETGNARGRHGGSPKTSEVRRGPNLPNSTRGVDPLVHHNGELPHSHEGGQRRR